MKISSKYLSARKVALMLINLREIILMVVGTTKHGW
jgi:hypothetical protein